MNVLVIMTSRPPRIDGDHVRFKNLFPLIARNNRLTLLWLDSHPDQNYLEFFSGPFSSIHVIDYRPRTNRAADIIDAISLDPPQSIRRRDPQLLQQVRRRINAILQEEQISIIHSWVRSAEQFVLGLRVPVVFDLCDALSLQLRERIATRPTLRNWMDYLRMRRMERRIVATHPVTFVAAKDAGFFRKASHITVIPNGVDIIEFSVVPTQQDPMSIVFSGSMSFPPNVDAVVFFAAEVWPRLLRRHPDLRWYIVGANPAPEVQRLGRASNIVVTGFVDDIRPFLSRSPIVIVPMVSGSGIKNKVLEAMALRRAVVSTPLGLEGIDAVPGRDLLVGSSPSELTEHVLALLEDPMRAKRIGDAARQLIEAKFSWQHVVDQYDNLYAAIAQANNAPGY